MARSETVENLKIKSYILFYRYRIIIKQLSMMKFTGNLRGLNVAGFTTPINKLPDLVNNVN